MFAQTSNLRRTLLSLPAGAALTLLLCACNGDSSSMSSTSTLGATTGASSGNTPGAQSCGSSCGTVLATMTDAPGDFLSYVVAVDSLQLQKADGTTVETVPVPTTVDFAQLVDLTELINAGQIPSGNYTGAVMTLDYSNAQITAQDATGNPVQLTPINGSGNAITGTMQATVSLDGAHPLVITAGNTARIAFDFNVAASDMVNLTSDTVTVSPTLTATISPSGDKQVRVRGTFASAGTGDFVVNVEPFWSQTSTGQFTVGVTSSTTYQINGTAYVGAPGLTALAAVATGTTIASFGTLDTGTSPATFTATNVVAGTSQQSATEYELSGTVIARSGNTVTLSASTWCRPQGIYGGFEPQSIPVTVGSGTVVTEQGASGPVTIAAISVGQHVDVFGPATQSPTGGIASVDATAGQIRLDYTPAWGSITSLMAPGGSAAGSAVLNLTALDGLSISSFTFAGTGTSSATDANAQAYVVNTGMLSQTGLAANAPIRVSGFVTPFGTAPPDFTASTLVNYASVTNYLNVSWSWSGSTAALTGLTASSTSLTPSLTNVGWEHDVRIGPESIDLTKLSTAPTIVPATTGSVNFTIGHAGRFKAENFSSFSSFVTQLSSELTGGVGVIQVDAAGSYDSTTNTFTATGLAILLTQ
ncbi:MAG TPA: DUF4382 domain-containing protein [Steroidobacteraceae bacterium]